MKKIKTSNYLKKEAQINMPGDPFLAPGTTEKDITRRFEGEERESILKTEVIEIERDWDDFYIWANTPPEEQKHSGIKPIYIEISYYIEDEEPNIIKITKIITSENEDISQYRLDSDEEDRIQEEIKKIEDLSTY